MPDLPRKTTKKRAQAVNLDTLGLEMGNKPPQALDVEEAVLGAMLIEPSSVDIALEELTPSCFYDPRHRMIFEAMAELVNQHISVDIVTASAKLRENGNLEAVGGSVFLADLSQKVGAAAHLEYYVKILKQKTIQRDLITASYQILKDSYDDSINVDHLIDEAQSRVYDAIQNNLKKDVQEIGSGDQRCHGGDSEEPDAVRIERRSSGFLHWTGSPGLAEVRFDHSGGQAFRGEDCPRPEPGAERSCRSSHAGGFLLSGDVRPAAGHASHDHRIRFQRG